MLPMINIRDDEENVQMRMAAKRPRRDIRVNDMEKSWRNMMCDVMKSKQKKKTQPSAVS